MRKELPAVGTTAHLEVLSEYVPDEFINELIPFVGKLNGMQWSSLLTQVRDLATRPRRTS